MNKFHSLLLSAIFAAGSCVNASAQTPVTMPKARPSVTVKDWKGFMPVPSTPAHVSEKHFKAPALAPANTYIPEINGNVLYPPGSPHYLKMTTLPASADADFTDLSPYGLTANGGGVLVDGIYYCGLLIEQEGFSEYMIYAFDGETWNQLWVENTTAALMATDLALDPTDGKVYGCFYSDDGTGAVFGTIDYTSLTRKAIAPLSTSWSACAINAEGELYAIDYYGILWEVDKETGQMTQMGDTGLKSPYLTSGAIDPRTGRMFYAQAAADDTGYLYEINTSTAEATLLYRFPNDEEIVGMYVCPPKSDYEAPAAVTGASLDFNGASLTGTVTFTAPKTTYEGIAGTGTLTYKVTANGKELASGNTTYGADVSTPVTLESDGLYTFAITTANISGSGPAVEISRFVGADTPSAPEVQTSNTAGTITLTWNAVTTGINGGYVDAAGMTYTVTRFPDNTVLTTGITETSFTDTPDQPETQTRFHYEVTATAGGKTSAPGISGTIPLGPITPPYREDFASADAFTSLTVIDANKDGNQWYHFSGVTNPGGGARIRYNSTKPMDDWLITPPLRLEKGKIYVLHVDLCKEGGVTKERLEIKYGTANTAEAMTSTALEPVTVDHTAWRTYTCRVEPQETDLYYIGFHGCSDKDQYWLHLDNIDLEAGAIANAPDVVNNLTVTPGSYGRHQAEIACNAPATDFEGKALTEITKVEIRRDGTLIHTENTPSAGQLILYTDIDPDAGEHTYEVVAHNNAGAGKPAYATVYIGTKTPVAPKSVSVSDNRGEVKVTWIAPDKDVEGTLINPSVLTYHLVQILGNEQSVIAENITGTSHTCTPVEAGCQEFVTYGVFAESEGGVSEAALSPATPVGTPYAIPFAESFANGAPSSILASETDMGNGAWGTLRDSSIQGVTSADGDNGYAAFSGQAYNDRASLITGKFDLSDAVNPALTFKVFNMTGSYENTNPLEVLVNDGYGYQSLRTTVLKDTGDPNTWNSIDIDLTPYAGKDVWLKFSAKVDQYAFTMIDDIRIADKSSGIIAVENNDVNGGAVKISTAAGTIIVEGADGNAVTVHTADGRTLFTSGITSGTLAIPAAPGIYMVKAGSTVAKVLVR